MKSLAWLTVLALVAAACSSADPSGDLAFPHGAVTVRASSDLAVGRQRLLLGASLPDGTRLGSETDPVEIEVAPPSDPTDLRSYDAFWVPVVPGVSGLYAAVVDFDEVGAWTVGLAPEDGSTVRPTVVDVRDRPFTVAVGEPAPVVGSPTLDDLPLDRLTTDPDPDERLYGMSLADAIGNGTPTVVVFATPAFCQTAACGPMLDQVKAAIDDHPNVDFVHVEVYEGFREPGFAPDTAHLAPAVLAWNLPTEPWVFVVDGDGTVRARFEGALGPGELDAALS